LGYEAGHSEITSAYTDSGKGRVQHIPSRFSLKRCVSSVLKKYSSCTEDLIINYFSLHLLSLARLLHARRNHFLIVRDLGC